MTRRRGKRFSPSHPSLWSLFPPPPSLLCIGRVKWRRKEEGEDECCVFRSRSAGRSVGGGGGEEIPYSSYTTEGGRTPFHLLFSFFFFVPSFLSQSEVIASSPSPSPLAPFLLVQVSPKLTGVPYLAGSPMCDKNVTHIALFGDSQPVSRGGGLKTAGRSRGGFPQVPRERRKGKRRRTNFKTLSSALGRMCEAAQSVAL